MVGTPVQGDPSALARQTVLERDAPPLAAPGRQLVLAVWWMLTIAGRGPPPGPRKTLARSTVPSRTQTAASRSLTMSPGALVTRTRGSCDAPQPAQSVAKRARASPRPIQRRRERRYCLWP